MVDDRWHKQCASMAARFSKHEVACVVDYMNGKREVTLLEVWMGALGRCWREYSPVIMQFLRALLDSLGWEYAGYMSPNIRYSGQRAYKRKETAI